MIDIPVYSIDGKQQSTVQIDEQLLGGEVRHVLLKQAYVMFHANRRQGTSATKGRSEKEGSTRKLYRQKGTGRARRGAIRTNLLRGGGVAFAKKTKSWRQEMPTKMRRLANRNALLSKIIDGEIKVVDKFDFARPETKRFATMMETLDINRTCLLALDSSDRNTALSARNIEDITTIRIEQLNVYDLLSRRFLLVEKDVLMNYLESIKSVKKIEEAA